MKYRNILAFSVAVALVLTGCGNGAGSAAGAGVVHEDVAGSEAPGQMSGSENNDNNENPKDSEVQAPTEVVTLDPEDMFSDRDFETDYEESKSAVITLTGSSAECSSDAVEINGSTITIKDEGTYIISGTLEDGMIIVDSDKEDKTQLVLNGANIHSKTSAPIYILQSDKVFITLAEGSTNQLSNGGSFAAIDDNNIDAVIFSKDDLTLNGEGSLVISSPAGHGIVSKDELTLTGGTYDITGGSHGLAGKDGVGIAGGTYNIISGKDGIHGENDEDGTLGYVYLQDGVFNITSEDDGISAVSCLQVEGGIFNIAAEDDAFHADGTLTINDGTVNISQSYEGLEGLHVQIAGGIISLVASDDGINAAGGTDASGFGGKGGNDRFGGGMGGKFNGEQPNAGMGSKPDGERPNAGMGSKPGGERPDGMKRGDVSGDMPFGGMQGELLTNMPFGGMPGSGSSTGTITISGGEIYVKASGDGIDANGSLTMSGGKVVICGPNRGDTATLDYDTTATITGGTFIGSGALGMAQTFSDSGQGVVSANVGSVEAGTEVILADKEGNVLLTATPELDFSVVILSSPEIMSGETYTLTVGSTTTDFTAE